MVKLLTMMSVSIFLVFFGSSVLAERSDMAQPGKQSQTQKSETMKDERGKGTQNTTPKEMESEEQKGARPGGVGEEGETSMFGSPATLPPGEHSPGYTGADKEAEQQDRAIQKERERKGKASQ
jgi:hypothetical protein